MMLQFCRSAELTYIAVIILMHIRHHHQSFTHTNPLPHLQHSWIAMQNLCTAKNAAEGWQRGYMGRSTF